MNDMNTTRAQRALPEPTIGDRLFEVGARFRTPIISIVVILALSAAGYFFWVQKTKTDEATASLALSKVNSWIQTGDLEKAIDGDKTTKGLKGIVSSYGDTPSGNVARLYLGTIYYSMSKPDMALATFKSFTHTNKDLQASALAGEAACYVQMKSFPKAADAYEKASAAADNEALKSQYLNKAAESHDAAGAPDKAVKIYEEIIKNWPGSSAAGVAQRSMLRLAGEGVKIVQP
jgi:tetratricopeptide (TPR) repeat protein